MNISRSISRSIVHGDDSPPVPDPEPSTVSFTAAQILQGFTGPLNGTHGRQTRTLWTGFVTGTEALLTATTDFGDFDGVIQVAIDGGAFGYAPRSGQVFTLFTGLAQAKHLVEFRYPEGVGDGAYLPTTGNVLQVTGILPAVQTCPSVQVGTDLATGLYAGATYDNDDPSFLPKLQAPKGEDYGSNIGSAKLRGSFNNLIVTTVALRRVGVSKNGAAPVFHTLAAEVGESGNAPSRAMVIPCDGSLATYNVWDDGVVRNSGGVFAVAGDAALQDIGVRRRMIQFGDSQTFGSGPGAISSDVETMQVAAALGFVGTTIGRSGLTIEDLLVMLDTVLPAMAVNSSDAAILAIGANNAGAGISPTDQANYLANINKLKAKGFGKILCRAILPPNEDPSMADPANALLKSVVDNLADPNVIWIATRTWSPWGTEDGAHPTAAGYRTLAGYAIPAYGAVL